MPFHLSAHSLVSEYILKDPPVYSEEEIFVWKKMVDNIIRSFEKYKEFIYPPFKKGFYSLGLNNFFIPDANKINQKLSSIGWQAVYINGFVPAGIYALMLANQIFPVSAYIRPLKYFNYSAAPDILAHLLMLFVKGFRELLKKVGYKGSQCKITFLDEQTYRVTAALISALTHQKSNFVRTVASNKI